MVGLLGLPESFLVEILGPVDVGESGSLSVDEGVIDGLVDALHAVDALFEMNADGARVELFPYGEGRDLAVNVNGTAAKIP